MSNPVRFRIASLVFSAALLGAGPVKIPIDLSSEHWVIRDEKAKVQEYKGKTAIFLEGSRRPIQPGLAYFNDLVFENGIIECDIASSVKRAYVGIAFRVQSEDSYELIYFEPHRSGKWDAIQYDPVFNGSSTWQLHHGPGYQAEAEIPAKRWFHAQIVVRGLRAEVYLDDASIPSLVVDKLQHGYGKGYVGVWSYYPGNIANLLVRPDPTPSARPVREERRPDPHYLTVWQVSEPFVTEQTDFGALLSEAKQPLQWNPVTSEPSGIINLNRRFRTPPGKAAVVLARTTIHSHQQQMKRLSFGYSDEIVVFLNSEELFKGDNSYSWFRGRMGYVKDGEDTVELSLEKGHNELVLAVSEKAFGWGFICRLDDIEGLRINGEADD